MAKSSESIDFLEAIVGAVVSGEAPSDATLAKVRVGLTQAEAKRTLLSHAQGQYHATRLVKMSRLIDKLEDQMFPDNWEDLVQLSPDELLGFLKHFSKERENSTAYLAGPVPVAAAEAEDALKEVRRQPSPEEIASTKALQDHIRNLPPEKLRQLQMMRESQKHKAALPNALPAEPEILPPSTSGDA